MRRIASLALEGFLAGFVLATLLVLAVHVFFGGGNPDISGFKSDISSQAESLER